MRRAGAASGRCERHRHDGSGARNAAPGSGGPDAFSLASRPEGEKGRQVQGNGRHAADEPGNKGSDAVHAPEVIAAPLPAAMVAVV